LLLVHRLSNIGIYISADDHAPPHFHIRGPNSDAQLLIDTLQVIRGTCKQSELAEARAWAAANITRSGASTMSEADEILQVGNPLPRLASVDHRGGFRFAVSWSSGARAEELVDLAPVLLGLKVFRPLRDDLELLKSARVVDDGRAIQWGGDNALEIAAATVERLAYETMTPADFRNRMQRHGFSLDSAAPELGISLRLVAYYAKSRNVPRYIALATRYISETAPSTVRSDAASPQAARSRGW
jgi:hypothetical protein